MLKLVDRQTFVCEISDFEPRKIGTGLNTPKKQTPKEFLIEQLKALTWDNFNIDSNKIPTSFFGIPFKAWTFKDI